MATAKPGIDHAVHGRGKAGQRQGEGAELPGDVDVFGVAGAPAGNDRDVVEAVRPAALLAPPDLYFHARLLKGLRFARVNERPARRVAAGPVRACRCSVRGVVVCRTLEGCYHRDARRFNRIGRSGATPARAAAAGTVRRGRAGGRSSGGGHDADLVDRRGREQGVDFVGVEHAGAVALRVGGPAGEPVAQAVAGVWFWKCPATKPARNASPEPTVLTTLSTSGMLAW